MEVLKNVENMLCRELEDIVRKNEVTSNNLDVMYKAVDIIKDVKTIDAMDSGYSNAYRDDYSGMFRPWYSYEGMHGNSYDGNSYGRGRYAERDSQGRYSSEGYSRNSEEEIRRLMEKAGDSHEREVLKRALDEMKNR